MNNEKITILGGGAFGTAVATLLAHNGYGVNLWCLEQQVVLDIEKKRENISYLSGIKLSSNIHATSDLQQALQGSRWVFEAIPVKFLRSILNKAKDFFNFEQTLVVLSKGIEQDTLFLPTQIVSEVLGNEIKTAVMGGPNFAKELAGKCPSAADVASSDDLICNQLCKLLSNSYFKTYISTDPIGVQVGGAIKNVLTLASGLSVCQNTAAFILTRGFIEIAQISECLAGKQDTVYGLSGFGDLLLSATGSLSRNLKAGRMLAQGKSLDDIKNELLALPEGINTVQSVHQLMEKCDLDLPICRATYRVVFEGESFSDFLEQLIS